MNPKRPTPRHIIIEMSKVKEENLKNSKGKTTYAADSHQPRSSFPGRGFAGWKSAA